MTKLLSIALFLMSTSIAIWCFHDSYRLEKFIVEHLSTRKELFCEAKPGSVVKLFESNHKYLQKQRKVIKSSGDQFLKIGLSVLLVGLFQLIFVVIVVRKNEKK